MNTQNDGDPKEKQNDIYGKTSVDECIASDGNRVPVKKDDKTINDDIQDYMFLKEHKSSHRHSKKTTYEEEDKTYPIVRSSRSIRKKKKSKGHHHHKKKMKTWKKVVLSVVSALLAIIVLLVSTAAILIYKGQQELNNTGYTISAPEGVAVQNNGEYVVYNGRTYKFNENITNILCIGVDKRSITDTAVNGTGGQADVIELVSTDVTNGKTSIVNISRDTMTDVTVYSAGGAYVETTTQQICLSYAYGDGKETSCENTVSSVQRLFYNLPVKTYFALDLDGIAALNDSVGGVDVTSPESIGSFKKGENYHLEGKQAENFVRLRNTEQLASNSSRMQRQQIYLNSFINTAVSQTKENVGTPLSLFNASKQYSCTNLNPSKVCYLAQRLIMNGGISPQTVAVPGEVKMGKKYAEFYVNEKKFYEMFLSIYYTPV